MRIHVSFLNISDFCMSVVAVTIDLPQEIVEGNVYEAAAFIQQRLHVLGYTGMSTVTIKLITEEPA
jgi:hypothetical protein